MQPSTGIPSSQTPFNLKISPEDHSLSAKSLFKLSRLSSKPQNNQAIINLTPKNNPNSHQSSPLLQDRKLLDNDNTDDIENSEFVWNDEITQNCLEIDDTVYSLPAQDSSDLTLNSVTINNQTGETTKAFKKFLAELAELEEEDSCYFEDPQILGKQESKSLVKEEFENQDMKKDPLENYLKGQHYEEALRGTENPEDSEDDVLQPSMKILEGLCTPGRKAMKKKEKEVEMALERLENFNIGKLKVTKNNVPDMRFSESKEFQRLCECAGLNPLEYYEKNIMKFSQKSGIGKSNQADLNDSVGSKPRRKSETTIVKGCEDENLGDKVLKKIEEAQRKVREYDISKVIFKKDQTPDRRYKQNREYLLLLEQCEISYYLKN